MNTDYILAEKGKIFPKHSMYEQVSIWKHSDLSFLWVNFEYPYLHTHDFYELTIIVKGNICNFINGKNYEMPAYSACIMRPKDCHKMYFKNNIEKDFLQLNFVIKEKYMREVLDIYSTNVLSYIDDSSTLMFKLQQHEVEHIVNTCLKIQTSREDNIENNVFFTKILFNKILHSFFEQKFHSFEEESPAWLLDLLLIMNNPKNDLSIEDIAKTSNYSYSRLSYLFKSYTGYSIKQYLLNVKMNYAKELLSSSNLTTLEISSMLGYDSLSHFNHIFKKHFNCTPKDIRKRS